MSQNGSEVQRIVQLVDNQKHNRTSKIERQSKTSKGVKNESKQQRIVLLE